jgi:hypothetical protein
MRRTSQFCIPKHRAEADFAFLRTDGGRASRTSDDAPSRFCWIRLSDYAKSKWLDTEKSRLGEEIMSQPCYRA